MACTRREWVERRIEQTRTMIERYEEAILKVSSGAASYTLDTGQTRQTVTSANLTEMRRALESANNTLRMYENELCGEGTFVAKPGW
jgi:hypothetical protein